MNDLAQFCATFWPVGWYSQLIMASLLSVTLIGFRRHWWPLLVMWLSWVGARAATAYDDLSLAMFACALCWILLSRSNLTASKIIAHLYLPRVAILGIGSVGILPVFLVWELNNFIVVLQILMLVGDNDGGLADRVDSIRRFMRSTLHRPVAGAKALARLALKAAGITRKA